jgi:hypothetical protein
VRVPRTSLRAFGVALIDPDASGLVDVDLVVGSDGLPRDIRVCDRSSTVRDQLDGVTMRTRLMAFASALFLIGATQHPAAQEFMVAFQPAPRLRT